MAKKNRDEAQFDEYRAWQWCKHVTLRNYVFPWSVIVGRGTSEILAVDVCAGAGSYTGADGVEVADGSPIIFAKRARDYTLDHGPGRSMHVICVERNRHNFQSLAEHMRPYGPHVTLHSGALRRHVPAIAERLGDAPALILLDPIGVKPILARDWKPLLDRRGKTDLFITLHFAYVHRVGGMLLPSGQADPDRVGAYRHALLVDAFFNSPDWRVIAARDDLAGPDRREMREQLYLQLYLAEVIGQRHRFRGVFAVRERYSAPVRYWFVHASSHRKAHMLMNDLIVDLDEMLVRHDCDKGITITGQDALFDAAAVEIDRHRHLVEQDLRAAVFALLAESPGGRLPFGAIRDRLEQRFYGRMKDNGVWRVTKALAKQGELRRQHRPHAGADEHELISLATSPSGSPVVVPIRDAS